MTAAQPFLPMPVELRLPTLDLRGVRGILGLHENIIKEQVDSGSLVAWDISRAIAGKDGLIRRELRFLGASVRAWPQRRDWTDAELIARIYGSARQFIPGVQWYRAWNCDSGTMINLVVDGVLAPVPGTTWGRGRGKTPSILWDSAVAFLTNRRLS
jgi:hypothetical protein